MQAANTAVTLLLRAFVRFLRRPPRSAWAGLSAVILAVASTVAVHLISLTISQAIEQRADHLLTATHIAQRDGAGMADYFALRRAWRAGDLPQIAQLAPVVEGHRVENGRRYHIIGTDWLGHGRAPAQSGQPFVRNGLVADQSLGLAVGDSVRLDGEDWQVLSVVERGMEGALFLDIGDALAVLGLPADFLSHVALEVRQASQAWRRFLEQLSPGLSAGLPDRRIRLAGWDLQSLADANPEQQFGQAILFNLGVLGLLALLVAWFLVYQSCVLWLRHHSLLLQRLTVLGFGRSAMAGCFAAAFTLPALLATGLGYVAGNALARWLIQWAGTDVTIATDATWAAPIKAAVSGLAISLAGALLAFRQAFPNQASRLSKSVKLLGVTLAVGCVMAGVGMAETGLVGGFAAILAASLLMLALAPSATAWVSRILGAARAGVLTRLALRETGWHQSDLAAALGALILATAAGVGMGAMVGSFERDFTRMLDQRLSHDYFVSLPEGGAEHLAETLHRLGESVQARAYGGFSRRLDGVSVMFNYSKFDARESARYGFGRALAAGEALASERFLRQTGLAPGDVIEHRCLPGSAPAQELPSAQGRGQCDLKIAGEFSGFGDQSPRLLMDAATAARFGPLTFDRLSVSGMQASALLAALKDREARVQSRAALRAQALAAFDRTFAMARALTVMALIVAVVGLFCALTAAHVNQRATVRLLHTLGLTRSELRHVALVRGVLFGGMALAFALPLGACIGWMLCAVVNPRAFGWTIEFGMRLEDWMIPAALGLASALAASLLPALWNPARA